MPLKSRDIKTKISLAIIILATIGGTFFAIIKYGSSAEKKSSVSKINFKPDELVTKGYTAEIIASAFGKKASSCRGKFSDLPDANPYCRAVEGLSDAGWISVDPGKDFEPDKKIDRAELAKFIASAASNGEVNVPENNGDPVFKDLPSNTTEYKFIQYVGKNKLMTGHPKLSNDTFSPKTMVSRAMLASAVTRVKNLDTSGFNLIRDYSFSDRSGHNFSKWTEKRRSPSSIKAETSDVFESDTSVVMEIVRTNLAYLEPSHLIRINNNHSYTLSYYAKTDKPKSAAITLIIKDNDDYCYHQTGWSQDCKSDLPLQQLTTSWQRYTLTINPREEANFFNTVRFFAGGRGDYKIYLDGVQLQTGNTATKLIPWVQTFRDVSDSHWAYLEIEAVSRAGIMKGEETKSN